jgi:hypothetical protein
MNIRNIKCNNTNTLFIRNTTKIVIAQISKNSYFYFFFLLTLFNDFIVNYL